MAYYININGRLESVSEQEYLAFNLGSPGNPAASGTLTQLNNQQQILNPNTTNNTPGNQISTFPQELSAFAPPITAADQANIDALNRIEARRAEPAEPLGSVGDQIARARAAGELPPEQPLTAADQANIDAINRIEANKAAAAESDPYEQARLQSIADETTAPTEQAVIDEEEDPFERARLEASQREDTSPTEQAVIDEEEDPFERARLEASQREDTAPTEQDVVDAGQDAKLSQEEEGQLREFQSQQRALLSAENIPAEPSGPLPSANKTTTAQAAAQTAGANIQNLVAQARQQQELRNQRQDKAQSSDWRVRLRLAPNSNYLYNSSQPGLLAPLASSTGTDGVIFPYTPAIDTAYKANYDTYDLTHSNYRGYFYKNSYVDVVNIRAQFTAQDTKEADYLLAVIHFFRSATKMFYGQDALNGSPPPLVYLSGYGVNQFNEHPCAIGQFNYSLPPDVDYIRSGSALSNGTNMLPNRTRQANPTNPVSYAINRLKNNGLTLGALATRPAVTSNLEVKTPSYVPTKMEISITLLPIQSRSQVSKQFSLQGFSNGNLLRAGFW